MANALFREKKKREGVGTGEITRKATHSRQSNEGESELVWETTHTEVTQQGS